MVQRRVSASGDVVARAPGAGLGPAVPAASMVPEGLGEELWKLGRLALPMALSNLSEIWQNVVALAVLGQVCGEGELAAAALGTALANMTGVSLVWGLTEALDTICGQAYGARNGLLLSDTLQRGTLILVCALVPVAGLWMRADEVLMMLGQDETLARGAARFLRAMVPGLFFFSVGTSLMRFLTAQAVAGPIFVIAGCAMGVQTLAVYVAVKVLGLGLVGAGAAWCVTQAFRLSAMIAVCVAVHRQKVADGPANLIAWHGFSVRAVTTGWRRFLALAVPAYFMVALEWWCFEVVAVFAGLLARPKHAVSVETIGVNIIALLFIFPMGLGIGTSVRVGNHLGAGTASGAHRVVHLSILLSMLVWLGLAVVLLPFRHVVAAFFLRRPGSPRAEMEEASILREVAGIVVIVLIGQLFDGIKEVCNGAIRGAGEQTLGFATSTIAYAVVAVPACWVFAFGVGQRWMPGVPGLFLGLTLSSVVHAVLNCIVVARLNFQHEVARAAKLTAREPTKGDPRIEELRPLLDP